MKKLLQWWRKRRLRIACEQMAEARARVEASKKVNLMAPQWEREQYIKQCGKLARAEERVEQLMRQ